MLPTTPSPQPPPSSTATGAIRVLVADDHPLLREGVAAVIGKHADLRLVGEAGSGEDAVAQVRALRPDVTLMDLQMPGIGGLEAIARIRAETPDARIIVLTTYGGDVQAMRALRAGARGYLLKNALRKELIDAIRRVHAGEPCVAPSVATGLAGTTGDGELTPREIDVLQRVAQGHSNKRVADGLSVTEDAVKARMKSILAKLRAKDRAHAVAIGLRRGFIRILVAHPAAARAGAADVVAGVSVSKDAEGG